MYENKLKGADSVVFDYNALKILIRRKYTYIEFAEKIGMTVSQLERKLNNRTRLYVDEMLKMVDVLGIQPEDINKYFFVVKVANSEQGVTYGENDN